MKKLKPIVKSEMSEDKLLLLCKIFYPENKWGSKKWYKYDIDNGRKRYEPDVHSDDKKLIFEYEGPIEAPIKKGDVLGILNVYVSEELKKQINILAAEDIERSNIFSRIIKSLNYLVWGDV